MVDDQAGPLTDPVGWGPPLDAPRRSALGAVFAATGAAALISQVAWQRIIALHAGMDLESSATVVAAFLAGLGLGFLAGGAVADRCTRRRALLALAGSNLVVALYGVVSVWLLYDLYRHLARTLDPLPARMAFNAALLIVPTFFGGMGLPLMARVITTDVDGAGAQVGRFNALNTFGAALGALVANWFLLGMYGFAGSVRIAAGLHLLAALLYLAVRAVGWRGGAATRRARAMGAGVTVSMVVGTWLLADVFFGSIRRFGELHLPVAVASSVAVAALGWAIFLATGSAPNPAVEAGEPREAPASAPDLMDGARRPWPARTWYLVYGCTGAVALGFEVVVLRIVAGVMRSNTYTFGHVLGLYLAMLAVGGLLGSWLQPRVADQRRTFLWLQFSVGASALLGVVVVVSVLPHTPLSSTLHDWFVTDGFTDGFVAGLPTMALFGVGIPLVLLGLPVLAMGASHPFAQGLVTDDLAHLGDRTGRLMGANIVGNVVGTLVTTFVLVDRLGSGGSMRLLVLTLVVPGVAAVVLAPSRRRQVAGAVAVVGVVVATVVVAPSNQRLWRALSNPGARTVVVAEDRSCASAIEQFDDTDLRLTIGATSQNGYPFDDFHVLVGLLPVLQAPHAKTALAVGFGIGSTSYGMLAADQLDRVTSVELCGGNYRLAHGLAQQGLPEFVRLDTDPAHQELVGDGRRHLLVTHRTYDVITPDTVRPNAPGSGNLYSTQFQALIRDRLAPGGITSAWYPTFRSLNGVTTTFPYVLGLAVASYNGSHLYLASDAPLVYDRTELLARFDALPRSAFSAEQRASLRRTIATARVTCYTAGHVARRQRASDVNDDLFPRDEYVLANGGANGVIVQDRIVRTCR